MHKKLLKHAMKIAKEAANLDYALHEAPACCITCSDEKLIDRYGKTSKGIFAKIFPHGMNCKPWAKATIDGIYIQHDLTNEQKTIVKSVFEQYYIVQWDCEQNKAIHLTKEIA